METEKLLALKMPSNDAEADTVRDYLKALLSALWEETEGFSGKRPFGNSGWQYDVYTAIVKGGIIPGTFDSNGDLDEFDQKMADKLILGAIASL